MSTDEIKTKTLEVSDFLTASGFTNKVTGDDCISVRGKVLVISSSDNKFCYELDGVQLTLSEVRISLSNQNFLTQEDVGDLIKTFE